MINMERMLFCSILLMVLLCGCLKRQSPQKYTARYGIEYNSVRDSLGSKEKADSIIRLWRIKN